MSDADADDAPDHAELRRTLDTLSAAARRVTRSMPLAASDADDADAWKAGTWLEEETAAAANLALRALFASIAYLAGLIRPPSV